MPLAVPARRRRMGLLKGKIKIAENFDARSLRRFCDSSKVAGAGRRRRDGLTKAL